jgi:hypothetical protein
LGFIYFLNQQKITTFAKSNIKEGKKHLVKPSCNIGQFLLPMEIKYPLP